MMMKFDPKDRCSSFSEIDYLLKVKKLFNFKQNMLNKKSQPMPQPIPPKNVN